VGGGLVAVLVPVGAGVLVADAVAVGSKVAVADGSGVVVAVLDTVGRDVGVALATGVRVADAVAVVVPVVVGVGEVRGVRVAVAVGVRVGLGVREGVSVGGPGVPVSVGSTGVVVASASGPVKVTLAWETIVRPAASRSCTYTVCGSGTSSRRKLTRAAQGCHSTPVNWELVLARYAVGCPMAVPPPSGATFSGTSVSVTVMASVLPAPSLINTGSTLG
jgi:hypothetical protein